jgi:deoxyribodipyrimidine photo-lyase
LWHVRKYHQIVSTILHWFRRDLRVRDNIALAAACARAGADGSVTGIFVMDPRWWVPEARQLGPWQAAFWLESLRELEADLSGRNIRLAVRRGDPVAEILDVARELRADAVTLNKEYEPAQNQMDERLVHQAAEMGLKVHRYKDAAVFEGKEILTAQGGVYGAFTPYKRAFLKKLAQRAPEDAGLPRRVGAAQPVASVDVPTLCQLGFPEVPLDVAPGERAGARRLGRFVVQGVGRYDRTRDVPALEQGTSRLSACLNAGTVSIRQAFRAALAAQRARSTRSGAGVFLGELIWREFYRMVLYNHPHTVSHAYQRKWNRLTWRDDPAMFQAWGAGRTGYPFVDAGMRQLARTGFMHNRLRMITAMFLTKDLDTHWVHGERYFRRMLMDYDLASNVGGWQWSASTGTDAAPYFRIMNPVLQGRRFDPEGSFVKRWVPELRLVPPAYIHSPWEMPSEMQASVGCVIGKDYPPPAVDHQQAKAAAVAKFRRR